MRPLVLAVCGLCLACGSEWAPVGPMLLEARSNDLAATQKYQSQELKLTGVVVSTGKKKIEHGSGRTDGRWVESPSESADAPYPFVQIRDPEHPSSDYVTCYLAASEPVPQLSANAPARVHGFFLEFAISGGHVEAVLNRCTLQ